MPASIEEYKEAVEWLCQDKSSTIFPNSSPEHAAVVLSVIIKNAKSEVKLYDDNFDGTVADINDYMIDSMKYFLSDENRTLKIVIRDDKIYESKIYKFLSESSKTYSNLEIRKSNTCFNKAVVDLYNKDINFAIGDSQSFRMEKVDNSHLSRDKREAICSFNRHDYANKLSDVFDLCYESCPKLILA